jgi:hypothetical protein
MQALAERLEAAVGGMRIERIDALQFSALKTVTPAPDQLHGRALRSMAAWPASVTERSCGAMYAQLR